MNSDVLFYLEAGLAAALLVYISLPLYLYISFHLQGYFREDSWERLVVFYLNNNFIVHSQSCSVFDGRPNEYAHQLS